MKSLTKRYGGWCLLATLLLSPALAADTAHVAQDAHIDLGNPSENLGTVPNLVVSNITDKRTGERLAFLSFDLVELPEGASLDQAYLRLFVGKVDAGGTLDLHLVLEPWEELGMSAMTAPDFETVPFTSIPVSAADNGHFVVVDVTPEVHAWLDDPSANHGFVIAANPGMDVQVSFDSKENSQTSHPGELELVQGVAEGGVDSADIADDSITSDDIADNTVGTDDIADGSIMSSDIMDETIVGADILDGSIGSADIDKDAVQLRVNGICSAGSSIREIDNMGAVVCEPDDDSGGDITSVQPIPEGGLQGGANSGNALLGIAAGGVDSTMILDHSIMADDIDANQVQRRVFQSCPPGEAIRAISPDGSVSCEVDDDTDTTLDPDLFWKLGGNTGTLPGKDYVGTRDNRDLMLAVNGTQVMRYSFISGNFYDAVNVLGGHPVNRIVSADGATIAGGGKDGADGFFDRPNTVEGSFGTIGGGFGNSVLTANGFIGGGIHNTVDALHATIGGGFRNLAAGYASGILGGTDNKVHSSEAFIGGGSDNEICNPDEFSPDDYSGGFSVIAGGAANQSCGTSSFIGGGTFNQATGRYSMVIGGEENNADGWYSLAAGRYSDAVADYAFALGLNAQAEHKGAFVWADAASLTEFPSQRPNQLRARATGGARFDVGDDDGTYPGGNQWVDIRTQALNTLGENPGEFRLIDTSTGAYLHLGGGWVNNSDRERKTDIREVDAQQILERVAAMPIQSWRYKVDDEDVRHIGPMAQDFHAAFGFGANPKGIMTVDVDGVALAAIQALYRMTGELEQRTRQLEAQQHRLDALEASLQALEARLDPFEDQRLARVEE